MLSLVVCTKWRSDGCLRTVARCCGLAAASGLQRAEVARALELLCCAGPINCARVYKATVCSGLYDAPSEESMLL